MTARIVVVVVGDDDDDDDGAVKVMGESRTWKGDG